MDADRKEIPAELAGVISRSGYVPNDDMPETRGKELSVETNKGAFMVYFPDRFMDWFKLNFGRSPIEVVRFRRDRRKDHKVFQNTDADLMIHWGTESYDIEEDCIFNDRGRRTMLVVQGCRKPIQPFFYLSAVKAAAEAVQADLKKGQLTELSEEQLRKFGLLSYSSTQAHIKMCNRNAREIMAAMRESPWMLYLCIGAFIFAALSFAALEGWIPSDLTARLEYLKTGMVEIYKNVVPQTAVTVK